MSSFKRRSSAKGTHPPVGTRALPGPGATLITSTGVPSFDDLLGGGLPLSCSLLTIAPDVHSAYGELLHKYFIVQGITSGQDVCIIDDHAREFVSECMWIPGGEMETPHTEHTYEDEDDEGKEHKTKIKIAWRYEQLKQFQTTVGSASQTDDDFCRMFDLTTRIPLSVVEDSCASNHLSLIPVSCSEIQTGPFIPDTRRILSKIEALLGAEESDDITRLPLRLCIPSFGSPQWGDLAVHDICGFLHALRATLKRHTHAVAFIALSPHLCSEYWGGSGWTQKLGWLSDTCISLSAFSANPSLTAMFPTHHGFVHVHSLPAPRSLQPPSDKFSTLRGLTSSGENNLAFKCMRKRLVFETLHLDLEGGVGERRTTPSISGAVIESAHAHADATPTPTVEAAVEVELERLEIEARPQLVEYSPNVSLNKAQPKKKVAFRTERPDLYDF